MAHAWLTAIVVTLVSALGAACGAERERNADAPAQHPAQQTTRSTVYFLIDDGLAPIGVRRTIRAKSPYAREALKALLAGPTREEQATGITTAIPAGTQLISMTYERHGADETVNLAGLPLESADVLQKHRGIAQIARTLIGVSGIERIWLEANGQPWGLTLIDGSIYSGPWGYEELTGWDVGAACPGTETVECDHFAALP
jgi:spore germination protein GerM